MEFLCFFLVTACALFGASELIRILYAAIISLLSGHYSKRKDRRSQ